MSAYGNRVDDPAGRRRTRRHEVNLVGTAISLDGSRSILIEDLSSAGARLLGRGLPSPGNDMMIRTDEFALFGRVAWAEHDRRGIALDRD